MTEFNALPVLVEVPWGVFLIYWILGALKTRVTREKEPGVSRYPILALEIAGYALVFIGATGINVLESQFLPRSLKIALFGVVLTWMGIGLAVWARYHLAEYWSARITIKEDHQLIRTGPYARLRHPIYTGLITATVGSALVIDKWRCVLGVCLVVVGYCLKASREETMLGQQFGDAFREHKKHTGFLIPRLR